ncbi:MAG: class I SAM-dependent methyltransferase [Bacilli bacterium]|jgi:SAM-dependent methyltransferase|nr:class I SAM-dependent methyltransferase [Bacilli bacterium]
MLKREKVIKAAKVIWIASLPLIFVLTAGALTGSALLQASSEGDDFDVAGRTIMNWTLPFAFGFIVLFLLAFTVYLTLKAKNDQLGKINFSLRKFWDGVFKETTPEKLNEESLAFLDPLDPYFNQVNQAGNSIIDVGCGSGEMLMKMAFLDREKTHHYTGLDQSLAALKTAEETAMLSGLSNLNFICGDLMALRKIPDNYFDGGITSNFLDVIPSLTAKEFIAELARIIKPGGILLVKLNFIVEDAQRKKMGGTLDKDGNIYLKGILRTSNKPNEYWITLFSDSFNLISQGTYPRAKDQPGDRLFVFQRR